MKERDAPIVIEQRGKHLDAFAGGYLTRRAAVHLDPPEMTPIDIALVGGKDDERLVLGKRDVLDFKRAGSQ